MNVSFTELLHFLDRSFNFNLGFKVFVGFFNSGLNYREKVLPYVALGIKLANRLASYARVTVPCIEHKDAFRTFALMKVSRRSTFQIKKITLPKRQTVLLNLNIG